MSTIAPRAAILIFNKYSPFTTFLTHDKCSSHHPCVSYTQQRLVFIIVIASSRLDNNTTDQKSHVDAPENLSVPIRNGIIVHNGQ
jgi:hypothetical protein